MVLLVYMYLVMYSILYVSNLKRPLFSSASVDNIVISGSDVEWENSPDLIYFDPSNASIFQHIGI